MAQRSVLLVGGRQLDLEETESALDPALDIDLQAARSIEELVERLSIHDFDTVIFSADLDPDLSLAMIRRVLAEDQDVSIHILTRSDDLPHLTSFVNGVLTGLAWHQWTWTQGGNSGDQQVATALRATPPLRQQVSYFRRIWNHFFGRSEPPAHPPPPPYTPGAM